MRIRVLLPLLVAVTAHGQGAPPPSGVQAPPRPQPPTRSVEVAAPTPQKASDVPDAEKLTRSNAAVTQMRDTLRDLMNKLKEARASKDVVKLNCVNEKLTQVKGLLRITEQADVALQEAISRQDRRSADHEFLKVSIAQQKVTKLQAEAQECIGQLAFRTDSQLEVTVEEPTGLPEDPTDPKEPNYPLPNSPPASPPL